MPINSQGGDFDIDIPSWVNEPYERRKAAEQQRRISNSQGQANHTTSPQKTRQTSTVKTQMPHSTQKNGKKSPIDRSLERDTYVPRHSAKHQKRKKSAIPVKVGAFITAVATVCGLGLAKCGGPTKPEPEPTQPAPIVEPYNEPDDSENIIDDETIIQVETENPIYTTSPKPTDIHTVQRPEQNPENDYSKADIMLDNLEYAGGLAWSEFDTLCDSFGLNEQEMANKIVYMCNTEEWGNGCIDPILLCAQMYHESYYIGDKIGDGGDAIGIGQFHKCAVDEVNRIYGTNYKYKDRSDPDKALEMMTLYLKYCLKRTGTTEGMLAMYNAGHPDAIEHQYGQEYVRHVYEKLDKLPNDI